MLSLRVEECVSFLHARVLLGECTGFVVAPELLAERPDEFSSFTSAYCRYRDEGDERGGAGKILNDVFEKEFGAAMIHFPF